MRGVSLVESISKANAEFGRREIVTVSGNVSVSRLQIHSHENA